MNILEVQDLCKTYGKGEAAVQALRHATFSVRKGEFIAIIGESGSGKSTLLNVVGALDKATSGKVWIDGQDIFSMPLTGRTMRKVDGLFLSNGKRKILLHYS